MYRRVPFFRRKGRRQRKDYHRWHILVRWHADSKLRRRIQKWSACLAQKSVLGEHTDIHITLKKPSGPHRISIIVHPCDLYEPLEWKSHVLGIDDSKSGVTKFSGKLMSEDLATVISDVF